MAPVDVTKKMASKYRAILKNCKDAVSRDDVKIIRKAFDMALNFSAEKPDIMGEKHINYVLALTRIVGYEIGLGKISTITSLLFVYVREGNYSIEQSKKDFGPKVSSMLDGLLKIYNIEQKSNVLQADNFRKLLFTITSDLRVILMVIAERLYVMRHLQRFERSFQVKYSLEVAYVYAPLAHRLGLYILKSELEDLSMKYREPDIYASILEKLRSTNVKRNKMIRKFVEPIKEHLDKNGFNYELKARTKSVASIWHKMKKQQCEFEEIYDIFAIRIIINEVIKDEKSDCWAVYSVVSNLYQPNPTRMRDWISVPKSNGYESLHTTVLATGGKWVEVQIRTHRMDEIAEKGLAAHWKYKGGEDDQSLEKWLGKVRDLLEDPDADAFEIFDQIDLQLYEEEIFIFTPKGELKKLPKGSTVLDFAFDIHSNLGATCVGARVNSKSVPIRHVLKSGDTVEIITNKNQKAKEDWLDIVITSKAKSKIKYLLKQDQVKVSDDGREILIRRLKNWKLEFSDENITVLLRHFKFKTAIDLYSAIAHEQIEMAAVKEVLSPAKGTIKSEIIEVPDVLVERHQAKRVDANAENYLIIDNSLDKFDYKLAKCCTPIYGDDIFGFITVSEGVKIHRINCPNAQQLVERYPYRLVKAKWANQQATQNYEATISLSGVDQIGLVNEISNIISRNLRVNMKSISFDTENGIFTGKIIVIVKDKSHLESLINELHKVNGIVDISRYEDFL